MFDAFRRKLAASLNHSGENSIVDLIAEVAAAVTGLPFRALHAGPQAGGDVVAGTAKIEVKRYQKGSLRRRELLGEILEAASAEVPAEVWVLVATVPLSEQIRRDLQSGGRRARVHIALLDWAPEMMPAMLVLLASAPEVTRKWLSTYQPDLIADFDAAVRELGQSPQFRERAETLIREMIPAFATYTSARDAAREACLAAFAESDLARHLFGQELTPLRRRRPLVERRALLEEIDDGLRRLAPMQFLLVLGDEGVGKSWVVADYWHRHAQSHLLLFLSSTAFTDQAQPDVTTDLDRALSRLTGIGGATSDASFTPLMDRWARVEDPRREIIVVLDGVNERPSMLWYRIINDLRGVVDKIGGQLVVTSRPRFWQRELAGRVGVGSYKTVTVDGFDDEEFAEAMRQLGRDPGEFPAELRGDLVNPRIFNLAAGLIGRLPRAALITKERVLWEYWRHRSTERENIALSDDDFRQLLIKNADAAFAAIKAGDPAPVQFRYPTISDAQAIAETATEKILADLQDVATGRFFKPTDDPDRRYFVFVPDKLWYALGLRLAYMAEEAWRDSMDQRAPLAAMRERAATLIEPFSAMDVAADIVAAAFAVAALHPRMPRVLSALFLSELIELRNRSSSGVLRFRDRLLAFVDEVPHAYLEVAERHDDPLIVEALRRAIVLDGSSRPQIIPAVGCWLNHLSAAPEATDGQRDEESAGPLNLFFLALRLIGGLPGAILPGLVRARAEHRYAHDLNWARWHRWLDETGDPPDLFDNVPLNTEPPEPGEEAPTPFASNEHLRFLVEQWLTVAHANSKASIAKDGGVPREAFEASWNLSLAPSFLGWLPERYDDALVAVHNEVASSSDPGEALLNLVEARVLAIPVGRRVEFLLRFKRPADAELTTLAPDAVLRLGPGIGERYLAAAIQGSRTTVDHDETLSFALDFLRRVVDLTMDHETAEAIAALISDPHAPKSCRSCALDLALNTHDDRIVCWLVEDGWCPADEPQLNMSLHGSDLIALAARDAGAYQKVRARLAANALPTAIEHVHDDDLSVVVEDLDGLLEDNLVADGESRENQGYMRVLLRPAAERVGKAMPRKLLAWCDALTAHLRRRPDDKEIADFAWSLLPGCAIADVEAAAGYLATLLDWHVEVTAHDFLQVNVPHLWISRAMGLPASAAIDTQLERLILGAPDDDTLWLIVETALSNGRQQWLRRFIDCNLTGGHVARAARARYLAALAGMRVNPLEVTGGGLLSAVERRSAAMEARRERFEGALANWRQAEDAAARFAAEAELFELAGRYALDTSSVSRHGALGACLAARLSRAQSEGREMVTASFLGLALPPAWMILANVPPRLYRAPSDRGSASAGGSSTID